MERRLGHVEGRPAAVFLMAPGSIAAGVIEQPLTDILPDRLQTVAPRGVRLLNLDRPAAAPAAHPEKVLGYLPKLQQASGRAGAGADRFGARVLQQGLPVFRRQIVVRGQPAYGRSLSADRSCHFFHLLDRRHAPARGSVGHEALEHMKNTRIESAQSRKPGNDGPPARCRKLHRRSS
jgi:hypothetical protein